LRKIALPNCVQPLVVKPATPHQLRRSGFQVWEQPRWVGCCYSGGSDLRAWMGWQFRSGVRLDGSSFGCLSHSYYSCSSIKNLGVMAWTSIFWGLNHPDWIVNFCWKDFGNLSSFWRCGKLLSCVAVGENLGDFNLLWLLSWLLLFFLFGGVGKIVSTRVEMFFNCRIGCRFPMVQECPRANRFQRDQVPGVPVSCTHDTPVHRTLFFWFLPLTLKSFFD